MKSHLITLMIALVAGYSGSYIFNTTLFDAKQASNKVNSQSRNSQNPFQTQAEPDDLKDQFEFFQFKIEELQNQVNALKTSQNDTVVTQKNNRKKPTGRITPNTENLIASGINADIAEDILRRMSQQDYKRLELQNLIQRSNSITRRQYRKELRELNNNKILLRSEMGDDAYDQYLFISGQNNRVKVSSVMAGSPAESSGFQTNDIILYYDNQKILGWPDIRTATVQGDIGSYTSVEIMRDGAQMSLMVPRGTLGVQLDAVQIEPD